MDEFKIMKDYYDPIEEQQMRLFACREMERHIHRYIKGMHGSKTHMLRFEEALKQLSLEEKEKAMAQYFDFNRRALRNLDFRVVVARSMANYSDSFDYLLAMITDKEKLERYLEILRQTYIRYHEVIEKEGKFGVVDHDGNVLLTPKYDFLRTCYVYVDDFVAMPIIAQLNGKMGLVLPDGKDTIVAPFQYDSIMLRDEAPHFEVHREGKTFLMTIDGKEEA